VSIGSCNLSSDLHTDPVACSPPQINKHAFLKKMYTGHELSACSKRTMENKRTEPRRGNFKLVPIFRHYDKATNLVFKMVFFFLVLFFFSELGTEPRALRFLGERSTTELNPQPLKWFL